MLNPDLWGLVTETAKEEERTPTNKIEELLIDWLHKAGKI